MEYYKFGFTEDNYITAFQVVDLDTSSSYDYYGVLPDDMVQSIMYGAWYKLVDGNLVVDQERKAEIIAKREEEAKKPTWQDKIEAQITYTAMMTDTLIEEE